MSDLQITLKAARVNVGLTLQTVSIISGKSPDTILKYERDSKAIPRNFLNTLLNIYLIKEGNIFFGKQSDFTRFNKDGEV